MAEKERMRQERRQEMGAARRRERGNNIGWKVQGKVNPSPRPPEQHFGEYGGLQKERRGEAGPLY